ncbi:MAG TPA: 4Fe-4S binding protein [Desulfomonilaceae bacterium]|nr:4Fe-4S binding protein [Desulfomonilaceae bacterium]
MSENEVYQVLADHLSCLGMGYPVRDDLIEILKENLTPAEARIALAVPTEVIPMTPVSVDEISAKVDLPRDELVTILEKLVAKGMLFSGKTVKGEDGYALLQVGFGFPQTFFWKGEDTPHSRKMAQMVAKYFNRQVTAEAYGSETKPYRYIPVGKSLKPELQAVYPYHMMESVIEKAQVIAVAHCPCRISYRLAGRGCDHPTEVCMKFDELAQFVIDRGLARELTKKEALDIIKITEEAGLVHFVDNSEGEIKHNCNCCGCACWNVGNIRRRKIPRDSLMAVYFIRNTDLDICAGCGECAEICPVEAVKMEDGSPIVDEEWCIGCGACATVCSMDAITMVLRGDRTVRLPATGFKELHEQILEERRAGTKG